jgi:Metalloenzyme superfamily
VNPPLPAFGWGRRTNAPGWGICPPDGNPKGDAIGNAKTRVMDKLEKEDPFCELEAHGLAVGLPEGLMGNSEGIYPPADLMLGADAGAQSDT